MPELEWKENLRYALENADDVTKIALYNIVYKEGPIQRYVNALNYVQEQYVDTDNQLAELDRLYSDGVPYYGDYIIPDCGRGDQVGSLDDLIEPCDYRTIIDYLMEDPFKFIDKIEDEEFSELVSDYINWKYVDDNA